MEDIGRRQCIPIIHTRGTHYEVGFDIGRTFRSMIKEFLELSRTLNEECLPIYETKEGRQIFDETLECVKKNFPQYVREIEGIANGAQVPFYKLFLLHMDDMTPIVQNRPGNDQPIGCSTIWINQSGEEILGHNEDSYAELLNHFYLVSAHIISDKPEGRWKIKEEKFTSLCYAGHLPGFTMSYNHHGLVFSVNSLCPYPTKTVKTPLFFILRALLAAENFDQAQQILLDNGCGAGMTGGCSVNMTFLKQKGDRLFHNVEIAPALPETNQSQLNILTAGPGENYFHCNKYLRLTTMEDGGTRLKSSIARMEAFNKYSKPTKKQDVTQMLGDQSNYVYPVFRDCGPNKLVKTIAVGIFDCIKRTWTIYADNPQKSEPLIILPIVVTDD